MPQGLAGAAGGQALLAVIAVAGGYVASLANLPAPWMAGGMLAIALVGNIWTLPAMLPALRDYAFLIVGLAMGSGVTPETVRLLGTFPISFVLLVVSITATIAVSAFVLVRFGRWSAEDAVLGSAPGALSTVLAIAAERRGDVMGIALVQNVRLLIVVLLLPISIVFFEQHATGPSSVARPIFEPGGLLLVGTLAVALGLLFERLGLAAGLLLGGAVASGVLNGTGFLHGSIPAPLSFIGFVVVGIFAGSRMTGLSIDVFRRHAFTGLASFFVALAVAATFAGIVSYLVGIRFGAVLLAFAPGGVEAMALLSIALDLEPLYVGAHHLVRVIGIATLLPLVIGAGAGLARWRADRDRDGPK